MDVQLRPASLHDTEMIYTWRNDPFIVSLSTSQKKVTMEEHKAWMERALNDDKRRIYIIEWNEAPVGQVRFEKMNENESVISVYMLEKFTGKSVGTVAIRQGCEKIGKEWPGVSVFAFVREENKHGASAFRKTGFVHQPHTEQPEHHTSLVLKTA